MNYCDSIDEFYNDEDRVVFSNGIAINATDCNNTATTNSQRFDKFCQITNISSDLETNCELMLHDILNNNQNCIYYDIEDKNTEEWDNLTKVTPQFYNSIDFDNRVQVLVYLKKNILVVCGVARQLVDAQYEFIKFVDLVQSPNEAINISTDITFGMKLPIIDVSSNGIVVFSSNDGQNQTITTFDTKTHIEQVYSLQHENIKCLKVTKNGNQIFYLVYDVNATTYRFFKLDLDSDTTIQLLPNTVLTTISGQDLDNRHYDISIADDGSFAYLALLTSDYEINGTVMNGPMHIYRLVDINTTPVLHHCASEALSPNNVLSFSNIFGNNTLLIAYTPDIKTQYSRHIIRCYDSSGNYKSVPTPIDTINGGMIGISVSDIGDKHVIYMLNVYDFSSTKFRLFKSSEFDFSNVESITWTQPYVNISINSFPSSDSMFDLQTILKSMISSQVDGELIYVKNGHKLNVAFDINQVINNLDSTGLKLQLQDNGLLKLKNENGIVYESGTTDGTTKEKFLSHDNSISVLSPNEFYWIRKNASNKYEMTLNPIPNSFFGTYSKSSNGKFKNARDTLNNYCKSVSTEYSSICYCWDHDAILNDLYDIEQLQKHPYQYTLLSRIAPCLTARCDPQNFEPGSFTRKYLEDVNCAPNLTVCSNVIEAGENAHFNGNLETNCNKKLKCDDKICPVGSECDEITGHCRMVCSAHNHCPENVECDFSIGLCKHYHKNNILRNTIVVIVVILLIVIVFALYFKYK